MSQTDMKKLEELVPEKFGLEKSIGKCSLCHGDIYEHDLIQDITDFNGVPEVAHSLCFNMEGGESE